MSRIGGLGHVAAVVVLGAGLVVGAARVPSSALDLSSAAPQAAPPTRPVTAAQLVCPGPETLQGTGDETAPAPAFVAAATAPGTTSQARVWLAWVRARGIGCAGSASRGWAWAPVRAWWACRWRVLGWGPGRACMV